MKKHISTIIIFTIIIGIIALGIWYSDKDSPIKELAKLNIYSKEELSFLEEEGFLNDIDSENLPSNKEQIISLLKSSNLIEQNLNSSDESFEVLATKLTEDNYQLAFKLENKSNQSKEFYLIPISESSQTEFKEIKGVVKNGNVSWGNQGDWGYDIEKHKQELRPELAQAYDDINNNGYTGKPIRLVLEANSTLLAQSKWEINRGRASDSLEPVYLLVYGSAGGVKDELVILNVHSHPKEGEFWRVSFETKGLRDLIITPEGQNTINDMDFVSLKCGDKVRTPQILENDVILYENWYCFEEAEVVHLITRTDHHTLKFEFGKQTAYAYNSPDLIDNLVSYWKLDDNFDNSNVDDIHSTNEGTVVNNETNYSSEQSAAGQVNTGFAFGGDGDRVDIPHSDDFAFTGAYTISLWVKCDDDPPGEAQAVINHYDAPSQTGFIFRYGTDKTFSASFYISGVLRTQASVVTASITSFDHIVFGRGSDNKTFLYVNGASTGTPSAALAGTIDSTAVVRIGMDWYAANERFFDGIIDEVAIWSRALTAGEISDLYNSGAGLAYPFTIVPSVGIKGSTIRIRGVKVKIK